MSYTNNAAVLQFPSHYVPVEAEEMEYIDGGAIKTYTISSAACEKIATVWNVIGAVSTIVGTILSFIGNANVAVKAAGVAIAIAGLTAFLAGGLFSTAAKRGGLNIRFDLSRWIVRTTYCH